MKTQGSFIFQVSFSNIYTDELYKKIKTARWGRVFTGESIAFDFPPYKGEVWLIDNLAWRQFLKKKEISSRKFLKILEKANELYLIEKDSVPFVVIPDIVMDGKRSYELSVFWLKRKDEWLPKEFKCLFSVQNGITPEMLKDFVDEIDGIFLGGDENYKYKTASIWSKFCEENGLWFHYARCGTRKKVRHAIFSGANSGDSSGLPLWKKRQDNFVLMNKWISNAIKEKESFLFKKKN